MKKKTKTEEAGIIPGFDCVENKRRIQRKHWREILQYLTREERIRYYNEDVLPDDFEERKEG